MIAVSQPWKHGQNGANAVIYHRAELRKRGGNCTTRENGVYQWNSLDYLQLKHSVGTPFINGDSGTESEYQVIEFTNALQFSRGSRKLFEERRAF